MTYSKPANAFQVLVLILLLTANGAMADEQTSPLDKLRGEAEAARLELHYDGRAFSGPGYERLVEEGRDAHFFLVGEEHGIAENPRLVAQLFSDLADHGYRRLAIEISPPMAEILDAATADAGLEGLRKLYATPGGEPAFFGMREEAEMLATVRARVPADEPAFWGTDYEVAGDRALLRRLAALEPPESAKPALAKLIDASTNAWQKWEETANPQFIFSFSADPALVADVRTHWPDRSSAVNAILDSLEETLGINQLWVAGNGYASNVRRGAWMRQSFLAHWQALDADKPRPRVMAKYGASHLVRGLNMTRTFDLGALIPELAEIEGLRTVSVMVLPGASSMTAVLDPTRWRFVEAPAKDGYAKGIEALVDAAYEDHFTLIELQPLRRRVTSRATGAHENLLRIVTGFDYLLIMSGSTASGELEHD